MARQPTYRPRHGYPPLHRTRGAIGAVGRAGVWAFLVTAIAALVALGAGPLAGWYRTLTVLSGSMKPGIPVGSVVVDTPEAPSAIAVGQVITYQIPVLDHRVVSHRVVAVLSGGDQPVFQTKGDANDAPDPWTAQSDGSALWRVWLVVPRAGWAILWLRRPVVHRVLVWLVPALLALAWLNEIWRRPRPVRRPAHAPAAA